MAEEHRPRHSRAHRLVAVAVVLLGIWLLAAYFLLPSFWRHHEHQPGLASKPMITQTPQGIPGDPINVGLVGSKAEVIEAMDGAGWKPADAVTLLSGFKIGASVALDRAYPAAPISTLIYDGQPQALAFERAAGTSAKRRHHVRFWLSLAEGTEGRPVWLGAGSYDRGVGLSRYTGQVTHHVGPDLDAERDFLIDTLSEAGALSTLYRVTGIGPTAAGRNGGGDPYFTDGDVRIGVIVANGPAPGSAGVAVTPTSLQDPAPIAMKNGLWAALVRLGHGLDLVPRNRDASAETLAAD